MTATIDKISLDQLSGGRARANALVDTVAERLAGNTIVLDCQQLVAGTASFADQFVKRVLVDGQAAHLIVEHTPVGSVFASYLHDAARDHGVDQKIEFR